MADNIYDDDPLVNSALRAYKQAQAVRLAAPERELYARAAAAAKPEGPSLLQSAKETLGGVAHGLGEAGQTVADSAMSWTHGVLLGADEPAIAGLRTAQQTLASPLTGTPAKSFSENQTDVALDRKARESRSPIASTISGIAGGAMSPLKLFKGASVLNNAGNAALQSGVMGYNETGGDVNAALLRGGVGGVTAAVGGKILEKVTSRTGADKKLAQALGGDFQDYHDLDKTLGTKPGEGAAKLGAWLREKGLVPAGSAPGEVWARLNAAKEKANATIAAEIDALDKHAVPVNAQQFIDDAEKIVKGFRKHPGAEEAEAALAPLVRVLKNAYQADELRGVPTKWKELQDFQVGLGDVYNKNLSKAGTRAIQQLERRVVAAIEAGSDSLHAAQGKLTNAYRAAKFDRNVLFHAEAAAYNGMRNAADRAKTRLGNLGEFVGSPLERIRSTAAAALNAAARTKEVSGAAGSEGARGTLLEALRQASSWVGQ